MEIIIPKIPYAINKPLDGKLFLTDATAMER
jgi:hypothetical protein